VPEPSRNVPSLAAHKLFETSYSISPEEVDECLDELIGAGIWYDEPRGRWLISRYDHARTALTHPRLLNDLQLAQSSTKSWALSQRIGSGAPSLLFLDPPTHDLARAVFAPLFSPVQIQQLARWIAKEAERTVAAARLRQEFDLATDLAQPFSLSLILGAFGLRSGWSNSNTDLVNDLFAFNRLFDLTCSPEELEAGRAAAQLIRSLVKNEVLPASGLEAAGQQAGVSEELLVASLEFSLRAGVVTASCLLVNTLIQMFSRSSQHEIDSVERSIAQCTPALEAGRVSASSVQIGGLRFRLMKR
jgi:cytochrome P450